jgi:hypothetical protein
LQLTKLNEQANTRVPHNMFFNDIG